MDYNTDEIMAAIIKCISAMTEVQSIGISGSTRFPKAGEGDIDVFIYCDSVPDLAIRKKAMSSIEGMAEKLTIDVFCSKQWGTGDLAVVNGVEVWLMYFTLEETISDVESILCGDQILKIGEEYYPTGRLAMFKSINIMFERNNFLGGLKDKFKIYPPELSEKIISHHIYRLDDTETIERAVTRKEVLLYHWALDMLLDHFLQVLFALNHTFFPSRKRTLDYINGFSIRPQNCSSRLLDVIKLGASPESINESYDIWCELVEELKEILPRIRK